MIQLGCCADIPLDEDSRARYGHIQEAGFDYAECNFQTAAALLDTERADAVRFIRDSGLPCTAMNCFLPGNIPLVGPNADLGKARRFMDKAFDSASAFGVRTLCFGSGGARRNPPGFSREIAHM